MKKVSPAIIHSISELHRVSGLHKPLNPLITIIRHNEKVADVEFQNQPTVLNFYHITVKLSFQGQLKYGKTYYDFDEGTMSFTAPKQIISIDDVKDRNKDGYK